MLFKSGYKFEEELVMAEEPTALGIESLKSFKAFCMFGHREFSQNLLRVMMRFESLISNTDIVVPERMLTMFDLFNEDIVSHVTQMNTFEDPTYPQSYSGMINKQQMIVHCSVTRPVQFLLGSISSQQPLQTNVELDGTTRTLSVTSIFRTQLIKIEMMNLPKKVRTTIRRIRRESRILKS